MAAANESYVLGGTKNFQRENLQGIYGSTWFRPKYVNESS